MNKTIWVYATDTDNAIERIWECREYATPEEALRKVDRHPKMALFEVLIQKVERITNDH